MRRAGNGEVPRAASKSGKCGPVCLLAGLLVLTCVPGARAVSLNLLIWEWDLAPSLAKAWTGTTGTDLNQIIFDNGERRDLLIANVEAPIDMAVIDSAHIDALGQRGLLVDQDRYPLPPESRSEARWRSMCGRYGVPYIWGATGIVYRTDRLATPPESWADLLRPAAALAGHIAMTDDEEEIMAAALGFLGRPMYSGDVEDLKRAFAVLKAQVPAVLTYSLPVTAQQEKSFHDRIFIGLGNSGDQRTLNMTSDGARPWRFVTPRDGAVLWVDCLAVLTRSRHPDLAERFVAFLARPDNAARNAIFLQQPPTNLRAAALLPRDMRADPQIYPPAGIPVEYRRPVPTDSLQLRRRIMSALVAIHDAQ
ncbi:polyamine ABC transporter substrate-binding protein [Gluconacetobacter tumulisoli]|uniref:Spermidine/putrescine ABC transporter substrate-binding protein n=1 Tax=Gluconacetobacter tumulisoli TaxID=1286189 RepID=A0A7W4K576_9PROT|nr:spermidine/putrescine ABC transporter substrate-binding protein [Gluconacetobacter tumulisoli]MBB2200493.1 spermidine/putrescine ABC transporter substrate-binding protein [Gluconacetobacter tumulisoli]